MSERKVEGKIEKIQRSKINPEGALMTDGGRPGKYKGNCFYCGIYGHKATVCHKRIKSIGKKGEKRK
jgi:hypothetical protein